MDTKTMLLNGELEEKIYIYVSTRGLYGFKRRLKGV